MGKLPAVILILAGAVIAGVVVKLVLKKKLENIDGFNGTMIQDHTKEETVIGSFGENENERKGKQR